MDSVTSTEPIATGKVTIGASSADVYRLISDPPRMVQFTVELFRAGWMGGVREARVGARFRGMNRNGLRRWWTICTVTEAEPGRRFAYDVSTPFKVPIARWEFDLAPAQDDCTLTVNNFLRVPRWFIPIAIMITGEPDRPAANKSHIDTTLDRIKAHLEGGAQQSA